MYLNFIWIHLLHEIKVVFRIKQFEMIRNLINVFFTFNIIDSPTTRGGRWISRNFVLNVCKHYFSLLLLAAMCKLCEAIKHSKKRLVHKFTCLHTFNTVLLTTRSLAVCMLQCFLSLIFSSPLPICKCMLCA